MNPHLKHVWIGIWCVALLSGITANAQTVSGISVPGTGSIFLAGQPNGTVLGSDNAPAESPVLVSLTLVPGNVITFSTTGITGGAGCSASGPDGCGGFASGTAPGISVYSGPASALIGVFLNATTPSGSGPGQLADFNANQAFTTLSPGLNQVFFIGDGLTGSGTGSAQTFVVPAGATRLFLGSADNPGVSFNNTGTFTASVTQGPAGGGGIPATPAPTSLLLVLTGLGILGFYLLRRRAVQAN